MKCQHCHKRKATIKWVGEGGMLAFLHGAYEMWCNRCCDEAQLAFAKKHKDDYKKLLKKMKK